MRINVLGKLSVLNRSHLFRAWYWIKMLFLWQLLAVLVGCSDFSNGRTTLQHIANIFCGKMDVWGGATEELYHIMCHPLHVEDSDPFDNSL